MVTNRSVAAVWSVAGMSGVLPLQAVPTRKCFEVSLDPTQTQHGNEMLAKFKDTISSYSICRLPSSHLSHSHVSSLLLNMILSVSVHTRLFPHDRAADMPAVQALQNCSTAINRELGSRYQYVANPIILHTSTNKVSMTNPWDANSQVTRHDFNNQTR